MSSGELTLTPPITTPASNILFNIKLEEMSRPASRQRKKIVFLLKVTGFYQVFISFILKNVLEEQGKSLICWDTFQISSNKGFCCSLVTRQWRNEPRQAVPSPWCDQILSMLFYCYIQRWQHWYLFDVILPTSHLHNYTLFYSLFIVIPCCKTVSRNQV